MRLYWAGIFTFFLALQSQAKKPVISLRTDMWCPHVCDPDSANPGYMVEIVKYALEKHGYQLDYKLVNWARAVKDTRDGHYSGIIGAGKEDAPDFIFPQEPQGRSTFQLFKLKTSKWSYRGLASLPSSKIGVINAYTYDQTTNKLISEKNPSFVIVSGENVLDQLIKMLETRRIDALYEDPMVLSNRMQTLNLKADRFQAVGSIEPTKQPLFVAFSPKTKDAKKLAEIISQTTQEMRLSGELQKILNKYSLKDWKD